MRLFVRHDATTTTNNARMIPRAIPLTNAQMQIIAPPHRARDGGVHTARHRRLDGSVAASIAMRGNTNSGLSRPTTAPAATVSTSSRDLFTEQEKQREDEHHFEQIIHRTHRRTLPYGS